MAAQSAMRVIIALLFILTNANIIYAQSCNNLNFETGDFTGWTGSSGQINGTTLSTVLPTSQHKITPVTNVPTTNGSFDMQIPTLSSVAPGGTRSASIGRKTVGELTKLNNAFTVTAANPIISYQYALVFQYVFDNGHAPNEYNYFEALIRDQNGNIIPCSRTYIDDALAYQPGSQIDGTDCNPLLNFQKYIDNSQSLPSTWLYQDWESVSVDLTAYIGQNCTLEFTIRDCMQGAHTCHGYVDASCGPASQYNNTFNVCYGESVLLDGPAGYASYSWSPGGQTTEDITVNTAGIYTLTVTSGNGCTKEIYDTVIMAPQIAIWANPTNVNMCIGDSVELTATGLNIVSYSWTPSTYLNTTVGDTVHASPPPGSTTYTVTGTDAFGCTVTSTAQVSVSALPVADAGPPQAICPGDQVTLTANGGFTYTWQPGGETTQSINVSPASTTIYTVTVTNPAGCTDTDTVSVSIGNNMSMTVSNDTTICIGGTAQLNADASANGAVTYSWQPGGETTQNISVSPNVTTTYTVTAENGSCSRTETITVTVPTPIILSTLPTNVSCNGGCDGEIDLTVTGGDAPYNYFWNNSPGISIEDIALLCIGSYTVIVTDNNGCTAEIITPITEPTPVTANTNTTPAGCTSNDGSATVVPSGGTPGYTFDWQPGGQTGATANNLAAGNYDVTVTDANGCTVTANATVGQITSVAINITGSTNATCSGACDGTATALASGGNGAYTYSWSNGAGNITNPNNLCAGNHSVTVTDANSCVATATVNITEPTPVTLNAPAVPIICLGQSAQLSATANGGTPNYTYNWMPGNLSGSSVTVNPTTQTIYTVTVTDANGCTTAPQTVTVDVNPPLAVDVSDPTPVCVGNSVNLFASASGGDGNYSYSWDPGALLGQSQTVSPTITTIYTVTVSDGCGTTPVTATVLVTIVQPPTITFTSSDPDGCAPWCVDFQNTTPNIASILWTFGDGNSSTAANPSYCWKTPGSYDIGITVIDNAGCTSSLNNPGYVNVYANPVAEFTTDPQPASVLNPVVNFIDLSSSDVTDYHWHFGDGDSLVGTNDSPSHTYITENGGIFTAWLMVENSHGCWDTISHPVEIKPDWSIYFPNTFTPNGDNHNDYFIGKGYGINEYEMWVYDRWGNEIYHCTSINEPWDGKVQNGPSNEISQIDTYVWVAQISDVFNKRHRYNGHVNLIK